MSDDRKDYDEFDEVRGRKAEVQVRREGVHCYSHVFDPADGAARAKFARAVAAKLGEGGEPGAFTAQQIEDRVLDLADRLAADAAPDAADARSPGGAGPAYEAVDADDLPAEAHGFYRTTPGGGVTRLSNFTVRIERDVRVTDDFQTDRRFEGQVKLDGVAHPFSIAAADFADNGKFQAAVFASAGPRAQFLVDPCAVRIAVSAVSAPAVVALTTAHGWDPAGTAYRTCNGVVDGDGFRPCRDSEPRVDFAGDGPYNGLGLSAIDAGRLAELKRHLIEDFLRLHERRVMLALLGAVALAVLERHAGATQRFGLWLVGLTGGGKSFAAKIAMNFFGSFPVKDGERFANWSSTPNFVERTGYYFRDALYLADDFKTGLAPTAQVLRVLQGYADGTGRGRLQADARANVTRMIRGLLVSTGEDLPEHNASALARSIVVPVPNRPKDLERGERCLDALPDYRGVTAHFIAWLITGDRLRGFAGRVRAHRGRFYGDIAGQQNDARIANNFALLAAAFEDFSLFLGDAWPDREAETRAFIDGDLPEVRDRMLGMAREQQTSEVFLGTLRTLLEFGLVKFHNEAPAEAHGEVIGRADAARTHYEVSMKLALAAVQGELRREGRDELRVTEQTLIDPLRHDGVVAPADEPGGKVTRLVRFGGLRSNCVRVPRGVLRVDDGRQAGTPAHPGGPGAPPGVTP